jgi:hypothetical protein
MKKINLLLIPLFVWSCNTNTTTTTKSESWTKEAIAKKCFDEATKGKYDLDHNELKKIHAISDCVGEKMVKQFKTEEEANAKPLDAAVIANECKDEYELKSIGR